MHTWGHKLHLCREQIKMIQDYMLFFFALFIGGLEDRTTFKVQTTTNFTWVCERSTCKGSESSSVYQQELQTPTNSWQYEFPDNLSVEYKSASALCSAYRLQIPTSPDSDTNRWGSLELKLHKMEIHVFKKKNMCVVPEMIWWETQRPNRLSGGGGSLEVCL